MNSKSGLTMASMILYVVLFFIFIAFAVSISTNMNYKILTQKGDMYINEEYDKLQYNLFKSAKVSNSISFIQNDIIFSNNDIYHYDSNKKIIYKNNAILVDSVDSFEPKVSSELNITDKSKYLSYNVVFNKYKQQLSKDIFVSVGDVND